MELPVKLGISSPLGTGNQWMSWIHLDDLCAMIIYSFENKLDDVFNAVAPVPVTNRELTKELARTLRRPMFMPNVPSFALKMLFGEMASMILGGNKVSSDKISNAGYEFRFPELKKALKDLYD